MSAWAAGIMAFHYRQKLGREWATCITVECSSQLRLFVVDVYVLIPWRLCGVRTVEDCYFSSISRKNTLFDVVDRVRAYSEDE
jgi:hypothetical protein